MCRNTYRHEMDGKPCFLGQITSTSSPANLVALFASRRCLSRVPAVRIMQSIPGAFDPGDRGPGIIAGNIVVTVLAIVAVGLRVLSRHLQRASLRTDDYLIFVALAFLATEIIWAASIPVIKISILLLYVRIFGCLRYFKVLAYIIGTFSICWSIMAMLVPLLQCRPIERIWDRSVDGTCINSTLFFKIGSGPNVLTDFVLLALPLPAVWNLHTTRAQKLSLTATFLLGSLTCIISLVRLIELITKPTQDHTWSLSNVAIWSTAESNLGIVSACMPTMKPLLLRLVPQAGGRDHMKSGRKSGSISSSRRYPSVNSPFGTSGFNRMKIERAREQFRELDDDTSEYLSGSGHTAIQTYISGGEVGRNKLEIPLNAIKVEANMDWQMESRENLQSKS
ncbi:MAG: hypothetical protein Q9216_006245 [Gyalolechia sp. 2 TL-2023]